MILHLKIRNRTLMTMLELPKLEPVKAESAVAVATETEDYRISSKK
jgi:hypothetical protein